LFRQQPYQFQRHGTLFVPYFADVQLSGHLGARYIELLLNVGCQSLVVEDQLVCGERCTFEVSGLSRLPEE
jgi:hypothetical protein